MARFGWGRAALLALAGAALIHLGRLLGLSATASGVRRHHLETAWYIVAAAAIGLSLVRARRAVADAATPASAPAATAWWTRFGTALLAGLAASLVLYGSTLSLGLLSDDHVLIGMPILPGAHWEHVRPLPLLVWRLIEPAAGAAGVHALNVLLHGVNAALVFALARRLAPDAPAVAWLAAAVFVSSPIAVEPIAWAAGVFDTGLVTCALGYLLCLTATGAPSRTLPPAFLCLVAALATKETAVALPVLAALLALRLRVPWMAVAASAAVAGAYTVARLQGADAPVGDVSARYLAKEILSRSFGAVGQPWPSADVSALPLVLGAAVPFGYALLIVGYAAGRVGSWRGLTTAAWVVVGALPVLGLFFVTGDLAGSRYAYLPLVGWAILIAELAWRQGGVMARRAGVAFVVGVVLLGVVGGQRRLAAWHQAATLRDRVIVEARRTLAATSCPAVALLDAPDAERGVYVFRNGLPEALRDVFGGRIATRRDASVPDACAFVWRDGRFVPAPAS